MTDADWRARELARARHLKSSGVFMASLCGLCTGTCAGPTAYRVVIGRPEYMGELVLFVAAVIGVVPMLIGLGLYFLGRSDERRLLEIRPPPSSPPSP
jgi:hypothetical protein